MFCLLHPSAGGFCIIKHESEISIMFIALPILAVCVTHQPNKLQVEPSLFLHVKTVILYIKISHKELFIDPKDTTIYSQIPFSKQIV